MARCLEPAIELARTGIALNPFQAQIIGILAPIWRRPAASFFATEDDLPQAGDVIACPDLAATLRELGQNGPDWFYRENTAKAIANIGGHLTRDDLAAYQAIYRQPLHADYGMLELYTCPEPSLGGALVDRTLKNFFDDAGKGHQISLEQRLLAAQQQTNQWRATARSATTQISLASATGDLISITLSNGESAGVMVPGTGIMLNNMLGEEDLWLDGPDSWQPGQRLPSIMAPSVVRLADGRCLALGSGGSNRIRSAISNVLAHMSAGMSLEAAISRPRFHLEKDGRLSTEPGLSDDFSRHLDQHFPQRDAFARPHLFFGGVHAAGIGSQGNLLACADARRGGATIRC